MLDIARFMQDGVGVKAKYYEYVYSSVGMAQYVMSANISVTGKPEFMFGISYTEGTWNNMTLWTEPFDNGDFATFKSGYTPVPTSVVYDAENSKITITRTGSGGYSVIYYLVYSI